MADEVQSIRALVASLTEELGVESTDDVERDLALVLRRVKLWKDGHLEETKPPPKARSRKRRRGQKGWPRELRATYTEQFRRALLARGIDDLNVVAEELDVTWDYVYRMRTGRICPSVPTLCRLADMLCETTDWLLGREDPEGTAGPRPEFCETNACRRADASATKAVDA